MTLNFEIVVLVVVVMMNDEVKIVIDVEIVVEIIQIVVSGNKIHLLLSTARH